MSFLHSSFFKGASMVKQKKRILPFSNREKSEFLWGWLFILPTVCGLIFLNIIPILHTILQSFYKTGDFGKGNIFVGLKNYQSVFHDAEIWQALWNTIRYTLVEVPISILLSLVIAVFLNKKIACRSLYRTIIFLPMVAAPAAIAMVWRWLYNADFGLINHIFHTNISWISNPKFSLYSIALIGIWSILGYNMVLFLAGLQEIPHDYYEAAEIDGAGGFKSFFYITVPLLSPTIFFVLVTRLIASLQVFDLMYMIMDKTNPALPKTQSLVYLFYKYSFINKNIGYGSTIVVVLMLLTLLITVLQMMGQKKWVIYN